MEIKVGGIYKCENKFVKIIHYNDGGYGIGGEFFGMSCNKDGGLRNEFSFTYSFSQTGRSSPKNPCNADSRLEEIIDEPAKIFKIKVGKTYMCGETEVLVLHHENSKKSTAVCGTFVAVPVNSDGEFDTDGLVGLFDDDDGCNGDENPEELQYSLREKPR